MRTASAIVALLDEASVIKLIEEIKNRPALYNKNKKQYSDMQNKKRLWMEVCEAVIPDWDQLKYATKTQISFEVLKKWNNLRTCFRREVNAQNGVGRKRRRKYVYYDNLLFLLPFTEKKDSKTDMSFEDEMGPACYVPEGEYVDSDDENDDSNPSTSKQSNQTNDNNTSALVAVLEKFKNNDEKHSMFAAAVSAVLDESFIEKLINTIAKRPGLYDKNKHYTDLHVKKRLWTEVCEEIIPHWDQLNDEAKTQLNLEVQKKWSNLRACFRREVKLNNKPSNTLTKRKRRKYIYYDKLSFLLPHIESQSRPCDFKVEIEYTKSERDTDNENSNAEHENAEEDNLGPAFYAGACYGEDETEDNLGQANSQEGDSNNEDSDNSEPSTSIRNTQPEQQNNHDQTDQSATDMKAAEFNVSLFKALLERMESSNEDKHFALSLVPMLQDMTPDEKIDAKINILQVFKDIIAARHARNSAAPNFSSQ